MAASDMLLVVPQASHLAALMERASSAVAAAGLTAQDYLNELPAVREALMRERYSADFIDRLREDHEGAATETAHGDERQAQ